MTPEERIKDAIAWVIRHPETEPLSELAYRILAERGAQAIRDAVAEERAANCKAVCPRCARGEPVLDVEDCRTLGHPPGPCHRWSEATHIGCEAAAIRARGDQ